MAGELSLSPPQPALSGSTLYSVLYINNNVVATVPMGIVSQDGTLSADIPAGVPSGDISVLTYVQVGDSPSSGDWLVAAGSVRWGGGGGACGTNLLASGAAWLANMRKKHASEIIIYNRDDMSATICAAVGRMRFRLESPDGTVSYEWSDKDFIITASDLVLGGSPSEPLRRDKITYLGNTYRVLAPGDETPWRWSDPYHITMRIHTKKFD